MISAALTALALFPANWLASLVETQTAGRLTLGDAQGTLWRGSAFICGAADASDPVTPLFPGRFARRLAPTVLLGSVAAALGAPLNTVQPSGQMRLSWQVLQLTRQDAKIEVTGAMNLELNDIASRLAP